MLTFREVAQRFADRGVGAERGRLRYHIQNAPSIACLQTNPRGHGITLGTVHRGGQSRIRKSSERGRTNESRQTCRQADVHSTDHDVQHQRGVVLHGRRWAGVLHACCLWWPHPCRVHLPAGRRLPASAISRRRRVGTEGRDASLRPRRQRILPSCYGRTRRTRNGVGGGRERNGSRRRFGRGQFAVTSTGTFYSGGLFNHRRNEYERIRGSLEQTGTESAHRTINQMGDRERCWNNDVLHRISKALVQR